MSEIKHEPGPWDVNDQRANGWMNNAMYVSSAYTGQILARVYNETGAEEANARLIAAAPELLEAARVGLRYIEAVCFNTPNPKKRNNYADAASIIRAAIAKATGGQS